MMQYYTRKKKSSRVVETNSADPTVGLPEKSRGNGIRSSPTFTFLVEVSRWIINNIHYRLDISPTKMLQFRFTFLAQRSSTPDRTRR